MKVLPGATIGVLGSGQLGRMFAIAARRMGYRVHTFSPLADTPTGQIADIEYEASYDDLEAIRTFASKVQVVTFEFENVPAATVEVAAEFVPVRPSGHILYTTQNRLREKTFLSSKGFPVTRFKRITTLEDLKSGLTEFGTPAILKTAGFGYDGKGQTRIGSIEDVEKVFQSWQNEELILEAFVDFQCELSVIAARGLDGNVADWGVIENTHRNHILDISVAPAAVPEAVAREATSLARSVLDEMELIGVMCIEFFLTRNGKLLINELAPRPHNSGHLTFDASITSQFDQQLRAVCGLPLGSTELMRPAAMANLLGDLWSNGEPDWAAACAIPEVKLHLYGKIEPKPGRKMGHLTGLGRTRDESKSMVIQARKALVGADLTRYGLA